MDTERLKRFIIELVVGLAIGALLLIADASRPEKPDDIKLNDRGECVYPMSLSFVMGFAHLAALLGFVSYFTFQHGCCCKRRDGVSGSSFVLGIFLAIVSWSLVLCVAGPLYLIDVVAIWPGTRGKPPECYTYLKADHHRIMSKAFYPSLFAITIGACSSKILSPPPIATSSLVLCPGQLYLMDVVAIRPERRGKAPECYTYLQADHHHLMKHAFNPSMFAIAFGV